MTSKQGQCVRSWSEWRWNLGRAIRWILPSVCPDNAMPPFIVIGWSIMSLKQQTKNFQTTEYSFIARNLVSLFHYVKWKLCAFVRKFCVSNSGCSINLRGAINLIDQIGFPLVSYLHIWKINILLVYHLRVEYKSVRYFLNFGSTNYFLEFPILSVPVNNL